jgi:transposase
MYLSYVLLIMRGYIATTPEAMKQVFGSMPRCRIAMETGTHSPWVSRLLTALGHEVIVGHAQKVRLITKSRRKDDRLDARTLARLARIDPELLSPVKHRSAQAQLHLTEIRARAVLVSARTALVNAARGLVKSYGERMGKCGTQQFSRETARKDGPTDVSGNGVAQTGEGCERHHRHGLCADLRGPPSLPQESRRGMFCGLAAWA